MKQLSFLKWIEINVKRRLAIGTILLTSILLFVLAGMIFNARHERSTQFFAFREIIADSVRTQNISVIQKAALLILKTMDGEEVALVNDQGKIIWSFPETKEMKHPLLYEDLRYPIDTIQGKLNLIACVPIFPNYFIMIATMTVSILLFSAILFWAVRGAVKKLSIDLSQQLQKLTSETDEIFIEELETTRTRINNMKLNERTQLLELSEKTKMAELGKIATQVAHDIRGPLSSMQTALGFFGEMKVEDKKFNDVMNLLQLSSKRLSGIADGLLKKHTGKEEQAVIFSLHKILDELIGEYHSQHKAITFIKKYPSRSVELHGDPAKLQRVFGNIIKNAAEAMEYKGTITITTDLKTSSPSPQPSPTRGEGITTQSSGGEGDYVVVSISDTGPGMSAEKLEKVLSGGYTEGKKDGHGIGMTVVRETVKENGGDLTVKSEIGRGTTFFISLPLPVKDQLQNATREKTVIEQITLYIQDNEPIIIIDDDPSLREQWRMVLEEKGKQTLLCESYEDFQNQKIVPNISHTAIVDYHFDNSEKTGGDVLAILKQKGFTHLYLCTAEYWKPSVQKLAEDLNVTLCPKPLPKIQVFIPPLLCKEGLGEVETLPHPNPPLTKGREQNGYTVLVIDDDEGVRISWEMMQERLGIADLLCYSNMEEMQSNGVDLNVVDIAFVDKNFEKSAFTGADVISFLKTNFSGKIVLASGENEKTLRKDPQFNSADFIIQDKVPTSLSRFLV